ncbi:MAG: L-threonylcarbamoyladenylate synthase [Candidatus Thorarchaeota archaeon]
MSVRDEYSGVTLTPRVLRVLDPSDWSEILAEASSVLLEGGLVVYPTDTSYGLGCDPQKKKALERLLSLKDRDRKLGVPLLFSDLTQCETYHDFGPLEEIIVRLFWPGALTLVVSPRETVPDYISGERASIAVRVPDHSIPRRLAEEIGGPIVGTSANRSGGPSPFEISVAIEQLGDEVDVYIDGGPSAASDDSTMIGVEKADTGGEHLDIRLYREGQLSMERISADLAKDPDALMFWTTRIV